MYMNETACDGILSISNSALYAAMQVTDSEIHLNNFITILDLADINIWVNILFWAIGVYNTTLYIYFLMKKDFNQRESGLQFLEEWSLVYPITHTDQSPEEYLKMESLSWMIMRGHPDSASTYCISLDSFLLHVHVTLKLVTYDIIFGFTTKVWLSETSRMAYKYITPV